MEVGEEMGAYGIIWEFMRNPEDKQGWHQTLEISQGEITCGKVKGRDCEGRA